MAHGFLESFDKDDKMLTVCSAGTQATGSLNMGAVKTMAEVGVDISHHTSDSVDKYLDQTWDYVITVCGGAKESCPEFPNRVLCRLHFEFEDPSHAKGTPEFIENEFRRIRDQIKDRFDHFYRKDVKWEPSCSCGCCG